jgi:hypothetical protein
VRRWTTLPLKRTPAAKQLDRERVSFTIRSKRPPAAALKSSGAVPLKKASEKRNGATAGRDEANASMSKTVLIALELA